jgi:hypothetical protein
MRYQAMGRAKRRPIVLRRGGVEGEGAQRARKFVSGEFAAGVRAPVGKRADLGFEAQLSLVPPSVVIARACCAPGTFPAAAVAYT